MAEQYIYTIESLGKAYAKREVLKNIWLAFYPGAKIGVIGSNGSGKSTLLRIMAGVDTDFLGTARLDPGFTRRLCPAGAAPRRDDRRPRQHRAGRRPARGPCCNASKSSATRWPRPTPEEMDKLHGPRWTKSRRPSTPATPGNSTASSKSPWTPCVCRRPTPRRPPCPAANAAAWPCARCCCKSPTCCCSTSRPTTSTPNRSPGWNDICRNTPARSSSVTHDRYFLDNVAQWILELDRGQGIPWKGNYSSWLEQKQARLAKEEKQESARRKALARELEWATHGARGARRQEQGPPQRLREAGRPGIRGAAEDDLIIQIPPGPHLGDLVVRAENVRKGYGDNLLMEDLNFDLPRGGIVGIIGANGAGKTTLFRMIVGQEKPDAGKLRVGETVVPAYVDQNRDALDGDKTVFEEITGGAEFLMLGQAQGRLARLRRPGSTSRGPTSSARCPSCPAASATASTWPSCCAAAATCCCSTSRPTTSTWTRCGRLEEALLNFGGCAVVISHDRWFLDRIATHILAFEGDSKTVWCEGNYQTYEAQRKQRLGAEADQPHRIRYKKLTR